MNTDIFNYINKSIRNESNMHIKYYRLLPISFLNNWDLTSLIAASFICWQRVVVKSCRKKTISWLTHMIYSGKDVFQVNAQTRFYYEWLIYIIATELVRSFLTILSPRKTTSIRFEISIWHLRVRRSIYLSFFAFCHN